MGTIVKVLNTRKDVKWLNIYTELVIKELENTTAVKCFYTSTTMAKVKNELSHQVLAKIWSNWNSPYVAN